MTDSYSDWCYRQRMEQDAVGRPKEELDQKGHTRGSTLAKALEKIGTHEEELEKSGKEVAKILGEGMWRKDWRARPDAPTPNTVWEDSYITHEDDTCVVNCVCGEEVFVCSSKVTACKCGRRYWTQFTCWRQSG